MELPETLKCDHLSSLGPWINEGLWYTRNLGLCEIRRRLGLTRNYDCQRLGTVGNVTWDWEKLRTMRDSIAPIKASLEIWWSPNKDPRKAIKCYRRGKTKWRWNASYSSYIAIQYLVPELDLSWTCYMSCPKDSFSENNEVEYEAKPSPEEFISKGPRQHRPDEGSQENEKWWALG